MLTGTYSHRHQHHTNAYSSVNKIRQGKHARTLTNIDTAPIFGSHGGGGGASRYLAIGLDSP